MNKLFLQAEWRKLAMVNYAVDVSVLKKYLPYKTEIDLWNGTCYISLVGFMFVNTRVRGFRIPFHINFEEVNLRFYVRHLSEGVWKRGVVFMKEIVPRRAITLVANTFYKENYETMPMDHSWTEDHHTLTTEYRWKKGRWNSLKVITGKDCSPIAEGSEEEFITEHYWGYTIRDISSCSEYGVEHPRWEVYKTLDYSVDVDFGNIYGAGMAFLGDLTPASVFLAEGSEIMVRKGNIIC